MPRQRAFRKHVVSINEDQLSAEDFNKQVVTESLNPKIEPAASPEVLPNVQIISTSTTDTKRSLEIYLQNETKYKRLKPEILTMKPMDAVEHFKTKVSNLSQKIQNLNKKAKTNGRIGDIYRFVDEVKSLKDQKTPDNIFETSKNSFQLSSLQTTLGKSFDVGSKVILELYPFKRSEDHEEKEHREATLLENQLQQLEACNPLDDCLFARHGVSVVEALEYVKKSFDKLSSGNQWKEVFLNVEKNLSHLNSLKLSLSAEEKILEEEKENFAKINSVWKFFQFMMEEQKSIGNAMIFYSVFSSVQKQLQTFGGDLNQFDLNSKTLLESSEQISNKLKESKEKISAVFIEEIQKELIALEDKIRSQQA